MQILQARINSALEQHAEVAAIVELHKNLYLRLCLEQNQLSKEIGKVHYGLVALKAHKVKLTYNDLRPGDVLGNSIGEFTFSPRLDQLFPRKNASRVRDCAKTWLAVTMLASKSGRTSMTTRMQQWLRLSTVATLPKDWNPSSKQ